MSRRPKRNATKNELESSSHREYCQAREQEFLQEEFTLSAAVEQAQLIYDKLSPLEEKHFVTINEKHYLNYRNNILKLWHNCPWVQLTLDKILADVPPNHKRFVKNIFYFLERNCFINYGAFAYKKCSLVLRKKQKICVIGSGISGVIAAHQLRYLGFDVIILEAMNYIGGRASLTRTSEFGTMESGCSFINGTKGNPARTMLRQLRLEAKLVSQNPNLYLDGELVGKKKESMITRIFYNMLVFLCMMKDSETFKKDRPISFNEALEMAMEITEASNQAMFLSYLRNATNIKQNINVSLERIKKQTEILSQNWNIYKPCVPGKLLNWTPRTKIKDRPSTSKDRPSTSKNVTPLPQEGNNNLSEGEPCPRSSPVENLSETNIKDDNNFYYDDEMNYDDAALDKLSFEAIFESHKSYTKVMESERKFHEMNHAYDDYNKNNKNQDLKEFLSGDDRRIMEWHFAFMEYTSGAPLSHLNFLEYVNDEDAEINSLKFYYKNFYTIMTSALLYQDRKKYGSEVEMNTKVNLIDLQPDKVIVTATDKEGETKLYSVDAVLCTLPLGVLKKAVDTECSPDFENKVVFKPPLPEKKVDSIKRVGCGVVNKVILTFESKFWGNERNCFGNAVLPGFSRGEVCFFYSHADQPILTAIICGQSADFMENGNVNESIISSRVICSLKEIFSNVPMPSSITMTHWGLHPYFQGSHSYISLESTKDDIDVLAEPVSFSTDHKPRLFFAGEHTNRKNLATVHGAMVSGLRQAGNIANTFGYW